MDKVLLLLAVLLINLFGIVRLSFLYPVLLGILLVAALALKLRAVLPSLLLFSLVSLGSFTFPSVMRSLPSLQFLLPLVISTLLVLPFMGGREVFSWARKGTLDRSSVFMTCLTGLLSTGGLLLWASWTDNLGIGVQITRGFSHIPSWLLFGAGVPLFALVNAFTEEAVFRGVLQEALGKAFRRDLSVLALQSSAFAAVHYRVGFPNGVAGYLMVFVYGLVLGYLRMRTRGMLAPYAAHVIADLAIGYFLCFSVR